LLQPDRRRRPEVFVPVVTLVYSAVLAVVISVFESPPISAANPWPLIADAFALMLLAAAVLVWRRSRIGYLAAMVMSLLFIAIFVPDLKDALTGFADLPTFLQAVTFITALVLSIVYSLLGLRLHWDKRRAPGPSRTIPASATAGLAGVGFILGAALIGTLASGVQTKLLASAGGVSDVIIGRGAADPHNPQPYAPAALTAKAGAPITWVNRDTVTHSVTSQPSGLFNSGSLSAGGIFTFTFARAGVYDYYCTVHPWMKGSVTVTGG
jgi:plastocyanin